MGDESGYQATEADITVDTLTGDIRDFLLGHMRDLQKPWQQMSEREQSDKIYAAESAARSMVRKAVNLITAREFDKIHVQVGKFTVKDGEIKAEFTTPATDANLISVRHAGLAVLVLADPTVFEGARSEVKADPDEAELPLDDQQDEAA
jgi:hypothetical protein